MINKNNLLACFVIACFTITCQCAHAATSDVAVVGAEVAPVVENNRMPGVQPTDLAPQAFRSVGMVLLFLGVLLAISWYVRKRAGSFSLHNSKRIKVLDRAILDMRHSVVLISVDGANFLIGVAPQSITAVAEIKQPADQQ